MIEFNDRRRAEHIPTDEDWETPLTWTSLVEANNRFRQTGVSGRIVGQDKETAEKIIKDVSRNRSYMKRHPEYYGDAPLVYPTVGEYLHVLNGRVDQKIEKN